MNKELRENRELQGIIPLIIMISNSPLGVASGSRDLAMTNQALKGVARTAADLDRSDGIAADHLATALLLRAAP